MGTPSVTFGHPEGARSTFVEVLLVDSSLARCGGGDAPSVVASSASVAATTSKSVCRPTTSLGAHGLVLVASRASASAVAPVDAKLATHPPARQESSDKLSPWHAFVNDAPSGC
jgi:hypothetical protein